MADKKFVGESLEGKTERAMVRVMGVLSPSSLGYFCSMVEDGGLAGRNVVVRLGEGVLRGEEGEEW